MKEMPHSIYPNSKDAGLPGLRLGFIDPAMEMLYRENHIYHKLPLVRNSALIAAALFLIFSVLDWLNMNDISSKLWLIRFPVVLYFFGVFLLGFTNLGKKYFFGLVLSALLVATLGLTAMLLLVPEDQQKWFFSGYIMIIISSFGFSGNRFFYGCVAILCTMIIANISGMFIKLPINELITQNFFLMTAALISVMTGYMQEKQQRLLFYQAYSMEKARKKSDHNARHDNLTGLPNRHDLEVRIESAISLARQENRKIAIIFIDLNDFKPINDMHGHRVGDLVLKIVAERLQRGIRHSDTVIRYGGDEFLIILNDSTNDEYVRRILTQIDKRLAAPVYLEVENQNMSFSLTASTGIALYPEHGNSPETLINHADQAMYDAKQNKKRA